jgi:hypothetical protein
MQLSICRAVPSAGGVGRRRVAARPTGCGRFDAIDPGGILFDLVSQQVAPEGANSGPVI